jgi:hypothetical protein
MLSFSTRSRLCRIVHIAVLMFALSVGWALPAHAGAAAKPAGHRLALVIGNGNYRTQPLKNAVNDANLIARTLNELGFEVVQGTDMSQRDMYRLIDEFREKAQNADVALMYYAGHGMQVRGTNYLIPVELIPKDEFDIATRSVNLDRIVDMFKTEQGRVNIIVIDACRDNPFGSTRSFGSKGLSEIQSRPGTLIAYSTSPGSTATDSAAPGGRNSIYSYALSNAIAMPGVSVEEAFKTVRREVLKATSGRQTPWEVTSLVVAFSFNPDRKAVAVTGPAAATALASSGSAATTGRARQMPVEQEEDLFYVPPEDARQELARMGVAWTGAAFAASLKEGDVITARLFVRGGKSVFDMADTEAVLGYLACGTERARMARMLYKQGIDLNRLYDRRYRIEGVTITEKSHLLHEWLSKCPDNDTAFAETLVALGVKWPTNTLLRNYYREDWVRGIWRGSESAKVLIRGGAIDPDMNNYSLYREVLRRNDDGGKQDAELTALLKPKNLPQFQQLLAREQGETTQQQEAFKREQAAAQAQAQKIRNYSITCTFEPTHSMQPLSECVEKQMQTEESKQNENAVSRIKPNQTR